MAKGGKVRHWKHGWIPVSPEAKAYVASGGKGPLPGEWHDAGVLPGKLRVKDTGGYKPLRVTPKQAAGLMAEVQKNGGFTWDPKRNTMLKVGEDKGFAVAVPGTEEIVGTEKVNADDITREDFAKGVQKVLMDHWQELADGAVLGGWYSPERNQYMVELTEIHDGNDREGAILAGKQRNQEAIFDISTGETVFTGGSGDAAPREPTQADYSLALSIPKEPLTTEEEMAAKYYTGPGFVPLNAALRSGGELTPQVAFYQRQLDSAIGKNVVKKDTTVYRGLNSGPWLTGNPPGYKPGDVYSDAGYMSTATGDGPPDNYKADVMMTIEVPAGTRALDLNGQGLTHHQEEREMLFPHGTPLRIRSDVYINGVRQIHAEVAQ